MVILIDAQLDHRLYEAVRLETGGIRRCVFSMNRECECRVLVQLYIFLIRLLKFTED